MAQKLDAVLFDMDGTLVRTFIDFPALRHDIQQLARHAYSASDAILQNTDPLDIIQQTLATLPPDLRDDARRDLYAILERHEEIGCERPEPIAGATELLDQLRSQSVHIGIVTRNTRRIAISLCERMHLQPNVIIAREDTSTYKPHPEPLQVACNRLHVLPERTAMVGDLWADVAAGIAAGCTITIGIQWAHDPPERFAKASPDHVVETLQQASDVLFRMML